MSNLLDKASIILTPTAYNNGEALCVKPSDGSGDFDFSRNSAATRVNAQGLVENVQILSSNLVQNGDFSEEGAEEVSNGSFTNGSTDWTLGTGWSIGEDKVTFDETIGGAGNLSQTDVFTVGKTYKLTFDTLETNGGNLAYAFGSGYTFITAIQANTTHTVYAVGEGTQFTLRGASNFIGSITNISVKEVGQNWDLVSANASIGENKLIANSVVTENIATQSGVVPISKPIILKFDLILNSGGFRVLAGSGGTATNITTSGTYTLYETSGTGGTLTLQSRFGSFDGSVTNLSIIEITTDTNLPRINYEGFSYQDALGSELVVNGDGSSTIGWNVAYPNTTLSINNNNLRATANASGAYGVSQILSLDTSKQYLIKATINVDNASGSTANLRIATSSNLGTNATTLSNTTGTSTTIFTPSASTMYIGIVDTADNSSNYVEIDNVSVKEYLGQEVVPDSGCGSWLFEPQSTNVLTYSELFSNAAWINNGATITSNEITSPSGTLTADLLTGVSGGFGLVKFSTWTAANKVASCFAKKGSTNLFKIANGSGGIGGVTFNLENGTVTNEDSGFESDIENYGNGWYRCTAIDTLGRSGSFTLGVTAASESVYIWGAMLEQNSFSTSYIPTEGSQVTRNQDVCNNGGSLATINSTEGTLYFEGSVLANTTSFRIISLSDATNSNAVAFVYRNTPNDFTAVVKSGGATSLSKTTILADVTDTIKAAISYKLNDFKFYVNGVLILADTSGNAPIGLNTLQFTDTNGTSNPFFGKTKAVAVWKEALSDAELTELTTI